MRPSPSGRAAAAALVALVAFGVAGCRRHLPADVVARVDGKPIKVHEVEAYVAANLLDEPDEPPMPAEDLDRVKSRLFDALLDECMLYAEAGRRGIEVSDAEVDAFLGRGAEGGASGAAPDAAQRAMARRSIAVQKLLESSILEDSDITDADVDAFLASRTQKTGDRRVLEIRSLMFEDPERAAKVYADLRRKRMTFDEAVAAYEPTPGQTTTLEVALGDLPEEVQRAVQGLEDGGVSAPTAVHGITYLFRVDRWVAAEGEDRGDVREWARYQILRRRSEEASASLLDALRRKVRSEVELDHLPFRYFPE